MRYQAVFFLAFLISGAVAAQTYVQRDKTHFKWQGRPYYYIGTNYWYGSLIGLEKDAQKGSERLRRELDFLASKGVTNLRVVAGAEGSGLVNGVTRIGPPLQTSKGIFNATTLKGLDLLLAEMGKRNMTAVVVLSNNWEWSGGFLQYLNWNGLIPDSVLKRKLSWDELRDYVSKFYTCMPCMEDYKKQVAYVLSHTNTVTGKKYINDAAVMAWELANEPRPMRPAANDAYKKWISQTAAYIKSVDRNHLVTIGHEGDMGTESMPLYEAIHADKNVDYATIHIWPKNWSWFSDTAIHAGLPNVIAKTASYIKSHLAVAQKINKPLVLEEFGLPRDGHVFDPAATTMERDAYYKYIFTQWQQSATAGGGIAGANFWAFGGLARPVKGQTFWKEGDAYMGDPPMEEQGLNTVFDSDTSTWKLIYSFTGGTAVKATADSGPSDKAATKETSFLYQHLHQLLDKGIMFGHQDDLAYGVDWRYVEGRSDVKEVAGDYPAVYGWELGNLEHSLPYNLDSVPFDKMRHYIQQGYDRGGVITISWHGDNPVNGESAWDTTHGAVQSILPGGNRHALYTSWLDKIAVFLQSLKGKNGEAIPVLFRPYHELSGNWFWWCRNTCTPAEFKLLWRFTVDYLRNKQGLHQLLYVYNTAGNFSSEQSFLEYYPGDDVVDMISFDAYQYGNPEKDSAFVKGVSNQLSILENVAAQHHKIPALGETGYERTPFARWWTQTLWPALNTHKVSYVLLWRNHGRQPNGRMHYYVPRKTDVSANDFQDFYRLDRTLFEKDVAKEKLYSNQ